MSSYEKNNFGEIIYGTVTAFRPANAIELGVLHGYSTLAIAMGLKRNKEIGEANARLDAYDLFEDYPFKHGEMKEVQNKIDTLRLTDFVRLHKQDAYTVHEQYQNNSISFLHIDLSNTGETLRRMMELWTPKIVYGGIILFEGGSSERDQIEWMVKFNKEPIEKELNTNEIIKKNYVFGTYFKCPSMTILLKKT